MGTVFPDELALDGYEEEGMALEREQCHASSGIDFEEMFQRYHSMVYNLALRVLGDREEALDVTQEVFFSIYRKMGHFRGESSLKTWIYRIAVNRASNRCRWWSRLRRRGTVSLDAHLGMEDSRPITESLASGGRTPEEDLLLREARREIERSLLCLPVPQRVAVVMRDVEGLSYEEIAEMLQVSLGTVKSRISRGREELKHRLNGTLEGVARRLSHEM
jgi:RNA polymerase sigma-70 factor (ECF subfamily)